jgi:SnoaL-like domain
MPFTGSLEGRAAIRELMDTHAHSVMTTDAELWGSIWADDASRSLCDYPDFGDFEGKATIVASWAESMKSWGPTACRCYCLRGFGPGHAAGRR